MKPDFRKTRTLLIAPLFLAACGEDVVRLFPSGLPNGTVGQEYESFIEVRGDLGGSVEWSVPFGELPVGLELDGVQNVSVPGFDGGATAVLSGTPEQSGAFSFTVRAQGDRRIQQSYTVIVDGLTTPLRIATGALPEARVGTRYSGFIAADGGSERAYAWSLRSGSLPDGLQLLPSGTPSTVVDGTPTEVGGFNFVVAVNDSDGNVATSTLTLVVQDGTIPLTIPPATLPAATQGIPYMAEVVAVGGSMTGYTWSAQNLPTGLAITSGTPMATISGTPTQGGSRAVELTVTDSEGATMTRAFTLTVASPPNLSVVTSSVPIGTIDTPYFTLLRSVGGVGPFRWAETTDALPPGLVVRNTAQGEGIMSGTPRASGQFDFRLSVRDFNGDTATRDLTLIVGTGMLSIGTQTIPRAPVSEPYDQDLVVTGGQAPYAWVIDNGRLPSGLSLSPGGTISGVPAEFGTFVFGLTVTDAEGLMASRSLTLEVDPPPEPIQLTTGSIPDGTVGAGYLARLEATGGTGIDYQWLVVEGNLPAGLTIQSPGTPDTLILGFPEMEGAFPITVRVTDSGGLFDEASFPLTITSSTGG